LAPRLDPAIRPALPEEPPSRTLALLLLFLQRIYSHSHAPLEEPPSRTLALLFLFLQGIYRQSRAPYPGWRQAERAARRKARCPDRLRQSRRPRAASGLIPWGRRQNSEYTQKTYIVNGPFE